MKPASKLKVARALLSAPQVVMARPSLIWFMCRYLGKFRVMEVGGSLVVHSHLPPLNSRAYARFVQEHLLAKSAGFSHAQIGVTNACPQNCGYCYNKTRSGRVMDTGTIQKTIRGLKASGVFWIGLTGGEPLLNKELPEIVETIGPDCASKLFTTGCSLTRQLAFDLKNAGLFSVSISLDHWQEEEHDRVRNYPGAFKAALDAIDIFLGVGGIHVGVSAVLSRRMLNRATVEQYLDFLAGLGVHEAWLSETKPSVAAYWKRELVISADEHAMLVRLQDEHNRKGDLTLNYLGHFEDARHFGCTAGHKMIYVDAFGEVSPCVFIPMSFGNVKEKPVQEICRSMQSRFPTENDCFINKNFELLQAASGGRSPLGTEDSVQLLEKVCFGPLARFFHLQFRREGNDGTRTPG
jgi:MoaA/NifB/PqqE/SkfB family radical SAM enzyme